MIVRKLKIPNGEIYIYRMLNGNIIIASTKDFINHRKLVKIKEKQEDENE